MKNGLESAKKREWGARENTYAVVQARQNERFNEGDEESLRNRTANGSEAAKCRETCRGSLRDMLSKR